MNQPQHVKRLSVMKKLRIKCEKYFRRMCRAWLCLAGKMEELNENAEYLVRGI